MDKYKYEETEFYQLIVNTINFYAANGKCDANDVEYAINTLNETLAFEETYR